MLDALVHDFVVSHAAMAIVGAAVIAGLSFAAVLGWRRRRAVARQERRKRSVLLAAIAALTTVVAFFGLVTAANLSTAVNPRPALLGFSQGSA